MRRRQKTAAARVLLAVLAACTDTPTQPGDGALPIAIQGLPLNVAASVDVTGSGGFFQTVTESGLLPGLPPGEYEVLARDVTTVDARYAATTSFQIADVPSGTRATVIRVDYALATARLTVRVNWLPVGVIPPISMSGPSGFTRRVDSTTTLHRLNPGTYTITAADVTAGGTVYRADPLSQTITLAPNEASAKVTVGYGSGGGVLELGIAGLPATLNAAVTVSGPANFSRAVAASTTLRHLTTGTYTIAAETVGAELTTYTPEDASQTVVIESDATASSAVAYAGTPLQLRVELAAQGLNGPVFLASPEGDPRLFVVERQGRIRVVENGAVLATPFLDIAARVNFTGERGMLGMAFDPAFLSNGRFFLYYVNLAGDVTVERFKWTPGETVPASDGIVITIPHGGSEHHGGTIAFGPDRMLYLGPGDGRCCGDPYNNAQNLNSLLGKILRIDARTIPYAIPVDNPFAGEMAGGAAEIWAYGLRNPWRFSFDPPTQRLYIGDVGQDAREEVNASPASEGGLNYGWPFMEGTACYRNCSAVASLVPPVHDYPHTDGCSVTGGAVYRGSAIPELAGHYLYSDYCQGWLRSFRASGAGVADHRVWSAVSIPLMVSFGQDGLGELYMIATDKVWRIVR